MRCSRASTMAMLLLGPGAALAAQQPIASARAEVVRVDAVVTDASGAPARELTREDFELFEDGKPQRITNFVPPARLQPAEPAPGAATAAAQEGRPGRRLVIVVDDLHLARASAEHAKEALRRLPAEWAGPEDEIALVTTSAPPDSVQLLPDRAALGQAIARLTSRQDEVADGQSAQLTPAQAELILRGDRTALQLATRLMMDEPGGTLVGSTSLRGATGASSEPSQAGIEPEEKAAAREVQRQARIALLEGLRASEVTLRTLEGVLRGLAPLPGPKLCLLVSDGFLVGSGTSEELTRPLRLVTDAATRAGVTLYTLQARGLLPAGADATVQGPPAPPGLRERVARLTEQEFREVLQALADETGGFTVRGSDQLADGLRRMLEDPAASYLLAYEPAESKRDGRFRKISVRLTRHPDLVVRARKGYFAGEDRKREAQSGRLAARPVVASLGLDEADARAALRAAAPSGGVPVRLLADYLDLPPEGPQAVVQAQVDLTGLPWQIVEGRHRTQLELLGGAYDEAGRPVGPVFGRRFDLDLAPADFERAKADGLRYRQRVSLRPGRYEVRLVAREPKRPPVGGAVRSVEIPDLGEGKLMLSSLFLSSSAAPAGASAADDAVRDAQLARRFRRGESLTFQLYVYNAPQDESARDVVLQAQIRSGANVLAASRPQPVAVRQKDGLPLPESNSLSLEGLAPGSYELRVVVVDRKANITVFRQADFGVE